MSVDPKTGAATRNIEEIAAGGVPVVAFGEDESSEDLLRDRQWHRIKCIFKVLKCSNSLY
ncbi:MAG: hypothetical protein U0930_17845 [Pirellulales bacterium]